MIVNVEQNNLNDIASLFDDYRAFYKQRSDLNSAKRFIQERIDKDDSKIFAFELDSRLVGFVQLYPSFSSVSMKRLWILNDLFVSQKYRNRGIARNLLSHSENFAKKEGSKGLTLKTESTNITAQKLYESLGWEKEVKFLSYNLNF